MGKKTQLFNSKQHALQAGFTDDNITEKNGVFYGTITPLKKELKVKRTTKELKVEGIKETKSDSNLKPYNNGNI